MKQIIIIISILALAGCTKSYSEVQEASAKCAKIGGELHIFTYAKGGVRDYACVVNKLRFYNGDF